MKYWCKDDKFWKLYRSPIYKIRLFDYTYATEKQLNIYSIQSNFL